MRYFDIVGVKATFFPADDSNIDSNQQARRKDYDKYWNQPLFDEHLKEQHNNYIEQKKMSKLGDIQNILVDLKKNSIDTKKTDLVDIIDEILHYVISLEREVLQLLQSRENKEPGQQTVSWETLRLDNSPFKINPLNNV